MRLKFNKNFGPYFNNTVASGKGINGEIVTDISNTGTEIIPTSSSPTVFIIPKEIKTDENLVDKVIVGDGFSPNGDGITDNLEIQTEGVEIETFEIYNRWGHLVWKYKGESSPIDQKILWDAISNSGLRFGPEGVPTGTYFYSLKAVGESKIKAGFITLVR